MQDDTCNLEVQRQLEAWAAGHSSADISPQLARKVQDALKPSLTPVKPLPSRGKLFLALLAVFAAGSGGLVVLVSKAGLHLMTPIQIGGILAILAGGGTLFALKLLEQMIPGSRPGMTLWGATDAWWRRGVRRTSDALSVANLRQICLRGLAIPATAVFWLLARKGALFASAGLGATITAVAAFLVLMPLQVQCMFQQAPDLLVWHGGTALLMIGLGALIGSLWGGRWDLVAALNQCFG